jgi:hypothetical protein
VGLFVLKIASTQVYTQVLRVSTYRHSVSAPYLSSSSKLFVTGLAGEAYVTTSRYSFGSRGAFRKKNVVLRFISVLTFNRSELGGYFRVIMVP